MIEFDVQLTKDNKLVVIHDGTVDRTTNGTGQVSELPFNEIRNLDAGSRKSLEFAGEKIPTFDKTLSVMPYNIWLNVHIKGEKDIALRIAKKLKNENRLHQAFLACGAKSAEMARKEVPDILICNMDRRESNWEYVNETIEMKADFIQLRRKITPEYKEYVRALKEKGVRVNYYGTDSPEEIKLLFDYGVDFPLVNDIVHSVKVAEELYFTCKTHLLNMKKQKLVHCIILTGAIFFFACSGGKAPTDSDERPFIVKNGTIDCDLVETTPVVFKNKVYRFEYVRPGRPELYKRPLHRPSLFTISRRVVLQFLPGSTRRL